MNLKQKTKRVKQGQIIAVVSFFILFVVSMAKGYADEISVQVHSGSEDNALGYSFIYSDNISTNRNLRWGIGYSYLDELKATWNDQETFFNNSNLDFYVASRHFPRSYNSFWRPFNFEFQAGASISLTENKFIFENFPDQEVSFSERGDVNFYVSAAAQYQLTKDFQLQLGYKYYPKFSEFDDQGSVFFGLSYRFGRRFQY